MHAAHPAHPPAHISPPTIGAKRIAKMMARTSLPKLMVPPQRKRTGAAYQVCGLSCRFSARSAMSISTNVRSSGAASVARCPHRSSADEEPRDSRTVPDVQAVRSFPLVLRLRRFDSLPLHVAGRVHAAALQRHDVIDDVPGARARGLAGRGARVRAHERGPLLRIALTRAVAAARRVRSRRMTMRARGVVGGRVRRVGR